MKNTARTLFWSAIIWEAASVLWFLGPFRRDYSNVGWLCIACGILCAVLGVVVNRR